MTAVLKAQTRSRRLTVTVPPKNPTPAYVPSSIAPNSCFYELKHALPVAYDLLRQNKDDEFAVFDEAGKRRYMGDPELADSVVKTVGLCKDLPFIRYPFGKHTSANSLGFGVSLYKTRNGLDYALISVHWDGDTNNYIVARKQDVFKLFLYFGRLSKHEEDLIGKPPMLRDGLMDNILKNSTGFLQKHAEFEHYGVRLSRGLILQGLPGNGKTMAVKWIKTMCRELDFTTVSLTSAHIEASYQKGNLTALLNQANVIVLDDVDISFLSRRKIGSFSDSRLACALLSAMDGVDQMKNGVVRIFTTNEEMVDIDPAFLRPGRIDKIFTFTNPDAPLRDKFVREFWHTEIKDGIDIPTLVKETEGRSFAEMDEVKTLLVQGFLENDKWDLSTAISEFANRKSSIPKVKAPRIKKKHELPDDDESRV